MIDARYIDTQRPCHKTSHHMRIFAVKRRQLRSTLTPCCTVFRSLPLPACFTCVSPGVMVSLTVLWFSSREHVKRLSKEHMEAKAEDHIRDIRTDAEIKQMDIEEAVPWLQFFQLRSYFSLLKLNPELAPLQVSQDFTQLRQWNTWRNMSRYLRWRFLQFFVTCGWLKYLTMCGNKS